MQIRSTPIKFGLRALVLLGLFAALAIFVQSANAATNNYVVKPSSSDWAFVNDNGTLGDWATGFETGPATPPLGAGSFYIQLNSASAGIFLGTQKYQGTYLSNISALSYSTYTNQQPQAISFQINYDPDLSTVEGTWYGRLVYEPYVNGTVSNNTWQTWDMINGGNGKWWASNNGNSTVDDTCPQGSPCTWSALIAAFPNIGIRNDANSMILFKAGSNWNGFDGNADNFTFETSGGDTDIYDFEPETPCTTTCYVNTATGNDSFGGDTPTSAKKTIQAAVNQVSVNGTVSVAVGTYNENVVINKNGITLIGAFALNPNDPVSPATHTIIDGSAPPASGSSPGININNGITNVTIKNLRVQQFGSSSGIYGGLGNNGLTIENVHVYNNNASNASGAGIWVNGPVDGVTINEVDAQYNKSRGIVIWNGFKQHITITNSYAAYNNCCGIELQDGTASGVTITGNTSINNTDSGIAAIGLTSGAGANVISNNTVTNNGRFGIEIKLPNGTGLTSGDGSIVVENNTVSLTALPADLRDYAGIAVFRRGWQSGNADIPTGVIVRNNDVSGYVQSNGGSNSTGFGIVAEGNEMQVLNNTLTGNDVGVQVQAGHLPYVANTNTDGDQSNLNDDYFGRGNSPVACARVDGNTYSSNGTDFRVVGSNANGSPSVHNQTQDTYHCGIQVAIDAATSGDVIQVSNGTYTENVTVNKSVTIYGASQAGAIVEPAISDPNCGGAGGGSLCPGTSNVFLVQADNVTIHDLTVDGDNPALTSAYDVGGANLDARNGIITNHNAGTYNNLEVYNTTVKNIYLRGIYASSGGTFDFHDNTVTNVQAESGSIAMFNYGGSGYFTNNTVSYANDAVSSNWSTGTEYSNNTVTNSGSGVHTDNNGGSGGNADNIHDNDVSDCTTGGFGVWVFVPYKDVTVHSNNVTNCDIGLSLLGGQGGTPTFSNNTIDGNNIVDGAGMYITTNTYGYGDMNAAATLSSNTFTDAETGMYIDKTGSATLSVTETSDSFSGSTTGIDVDANLTTSNVTSTATGDALIVRNGGSVTANNTLDLNGNATIESGGTLAAGTTSEIQVAGNWTNNGTFTPGTGKVKFDGAVAQTIGGSVDPAPFNDLDLSNSHANGITSNVNATVAGQLAMNQDSNLNMGANILTMGASSNPATAGTGQGDVVGQVKRTSFISGTSYNFGSPFLAFNNLTFTTAPTDIGVTLATSAPGTYPTAIQRTYTLNVNGGADVNTNLRLHYRDDVTTLNSNTETALRQFRYNGSTWDYIGDNSRSAADNWVQRDGVNSFSDWTLADRTPNAVLLARFHGKQDGAQVKLAWDTASEANLVGFNVWRARGKGEFVKLNADPIPASNSGDLNGHAYTYADPLSKKGRYQYKLELLTTAGAEFSEQIVVRFKPDTTGCATVADKAKALSPKNKAVVRGKNVQFDWSDVACATRYEFTLRENSADGALIVTETNLSGSAFTAAKLKPGVYFWSVRGCNAAGCGPARSAQFTLERNKK